MYQFMLLALTKKNIYTTGYSKKINHLNKVETYNIFFLTQLDFSFISYYSTYLN